MRMGRRAAVSSRWWAWWRGPRSAATGRGRSRVDLMRRLPALFWSANLVLWIYAIDDVGAGVATVLGNLQVLFIAAFAWAVLNERPGRRCLVMLPVLLLGVVMASGLPGAGRSSTRRHRT